MVFCQVSGFEWESIYNWTVDEFSDVFHSLQRNKAREILNGFSTMQQAFGGDKKSIKAFIKSVSVWLPAQERGDVKGTQDFIDLVKRGFKIKKK